MVTETRNVGAGRGDLMVMAKAIYDEVRGSLDGRIKELTEDAEARLVLKVGRALERELGSRLASLEERLASLERLHSEGLQQIKDILRALPAPKITIPENAIQVEVNLPKQQSIKSEKEIIYGPSGRPEKIIESNTPL